MLHFAIYGYCQEKIDVGHLGLKGLMAVAERSCITNFIRILTTGTVNKTLLVPDNLVTTSHIYSSVNSALDKIVLD